MRCRTRPAIGAPLSLSNLCCCLHRLLGEEKVDGEALQGSRPLLGSVGKAEGEGRTAWGVGGKTGKSVCAAGMCRASGSP